MLEKVDNKGQFKIKNKDNNEIRCQSTSNDKEVVVAQGGDERMGHWQFIPKSDGVAIYNPLAMRFLGPLDSDGKAGCQDKDYGDASVFYGYRFHMDSKYRLSSVPSMFKTALSAKDEGAGWGFQRVMITKWFGLYDSDRNRWFSAKKDMSVTSFANIKPGGWEKWQIEPHGKGQDVTFSFKSFHGKYLRCLDNGSIRADTNEVHGSEKFIIYALSANKIALFNEDKNRYVRMDDDGSVHCNEPLASSATTWTTPV